MALGSILRLNGWADIMGRGWCSQMLNTLAAYKSRRYCSSLPLLASVAGNVGVWGAVGPWLDMSMFSWVPPPHPGDGWLESGGSGLQGLWLMCLACRSADVPASVQRVGLAEEFWSAGPLVDVELEVWPAGPQSGGWFPVSVP